MCKESQFIVAGRLAQVTPMCRSDQEDHNDDSTTIQRSHPQADGYIKASPSKKISLGSPFRLDSLFYATFTPPPALRPLRAPIGQIQTTSAVDTKWASTTPRPLPRCKDRIVLSHIINAQHRHPLIFSQIGFDFISPSHRPCTS